MKNYFENCETQEDAKKQYKKLAKQFHPDINPTQGSEEIMKLINVQFENFKPNTYRKGEEFNKYENTAIAKIIIELMKLEGIEIEICGNWLWLDGNTYEQKEEIKAIDTDGKFKARFSGSKKRWYFSPADYRKRSKKAVSMEAIRTMYGSEKMKTKGTYQLTK